MKYLNHIHTALCKADHILLRKIPSEQNFLSGSISRIYKNMKYEARYLRSILFSFCKMLGRMTKRLMLRLILRFVGLVLRLLSFFNFSVNKLLMHFTILPLLDVRQTFLGSLRLDSLMRCYSILEQ